MVLSVFFKSTIYYMEYGGSSCLLNGVEFEPTTLTVEKSKI